MPTVECRCGARYRVPAEAVGKRGRCKKCGEVFHVAPPPPPEESDVLSFSDSDYAALAAGQAVERPDVPPPRAGPAPLAVPVQLALADNPLAAAAAPAVTRIHWKGYFQDLLRSVLILRHPGSLVVFLILVFLVTAASVARYAVCLGWIAVLTVYAWLMAYQFNVIAGAAAREQELPDLTLTGGWVEGVLYPFFRMLVTRVASNAPAAVFITTINIRDGESAGNVLLYLLLVSLGIYEPIVSLAGTEQTVAWTLVGAGLLIWPMLLLVVALGGVSSLVRVDLMIITIARSFPAYLVAAALVYLGVLADILITSEVQQQLQSFFFGSKGLSVESVLLQVGMTILQLYLAILGFRALGLYYHHFKSRFAWEWE